MKDLLPSSKRNTKYKIVSFFANVFFISIIAGTFGYNYHEVLRKERIFNALYISFSPVREIEYGTSNYDTMNFVESVDNGVISDFTRNIDTSTLGVKELKYEMTEDDVVKEFYLQVEVKDTKHPVITLGKELITVYTGTSFDFKSNVKSVADEIDGELSYSESPIENPSDGYYYITSNYDKNKTGTYSVNIKAIDKNLNETDASYNIKVIEKPKPKPVVQAVVSTPRATYNGPSSVDTSSVINAAKSLVGSRYVYASANPSVGFDCSGFVYYVYSLFGRSLARTASGIASNGYAVSEENMQPGDIIVWSDRSSGSPTHVSLYIGGGEMIHAANRSKGVIQSSVSGWKSGGRNRIVSIRRV